MFNKLFKVEDSWVVFYDLFSKNGNGDSVRPLAEELKKRRPDMKFFFCDKRKNRLHHIDMADEIITEGTVKFWYICSKAKYIISPMGFPNKGKKRKGQVFVQTWHGSPLKKLYLSKEKNKHNLKYASLFKNIDIFCSQAEIHNNNLSEALSLKPSQIVNSGLPRNDILFKDNKEFCLDLKKQLSIPEDKKILFYCPTWRRYDYRAVLPFDLNKLKSELSDEYVLLIRSHVGKHSWVDENNKPINIFDNEFSFDGGAYPEVTHLYILSDVLITDYSSSLFDFAITQKPQIFYAYDLENYKKEFGLYFDYETLVPGDIVKDTDSLIQSVKNLPEYYEKYNEKYKKFVDLYLNAERGNASQQVIDLMLSKGKDK